MLTLFLEVMSMGEEKHGTSQKTVVDQPWFWPIVYAIIALILIGFVLFYNFIVKPIETNKTVREIAKETGYSKSTVHKDLTERLAKVNGSFFQEVHQILAYHKSVRHIRGGQATRKKWKMGS